MFPNSATHCSTTGPFSSEESPPLPSQHLFRSTVTLPKDATPEFLFKNYANPQRFNAPEDYSFSTSDFKVERRLQGSSYVYEIQANAAFEVRTEGTVHKVDSPGHLAFPGESRKSPVLPLNEGAWKGFITDAESLARSVRDDGNIRLAVKLDSQLKELHSLLKAGTRSQASSLTLSAQDELNQSRTRAEPGMTVIAPVLSPSGKGAFEGFANDIAELKERLQSEGKSELAEYISSALRKQEQSTSQNKETADYVPPKIPEAPPTRLKDSSSEEPLVLPRARLKDEGPSRLTPTMSEATMIIIRKECGRDTGLDSGYDSRHISIQDGPQGTSYQLCINPKESSGVYSAIFLGKIAGKHFRTTFTLRANGSVENYSCVGSDSGREIHWILTPSEGLTAGNSETKPRQRDESEERMLGLIEKVIQLRKKGEDVRRPG